MDISVVIRTLNEEEWIGHAIQSVLDFFSKPEIVIIDNNSTDETKNIVKHFKKDSDLNDINNPQYTVIKTLDIQDYTPGKSLNFGIKNCTKDYVLIISSHCVLKNININKINKNLENHACVFGNQIPIWKGKRILKRYVWSHFGDKEIVNMYSEMENRYFMHNALAFFKKNTLINNPFDENLVGKEDRYWVNKMINKGNSVLYDPEFTAYHHYTINGNTWKGMG